MWHVHGYKNNTEKQESKVSQYFLIVIFPVFAQVSKVKEDDVDRYSQKERKKARKESGRQPLSFITFLLPNEDGKSRALDRSNQR